MRAEDIPDWVPSVIKEMALAIPVGETISRRLLTDLRMKGVWKYLQSREVNATALAALKPWQRLENWDIPIQGPLRQDQKNVLPQDRACAAFFAYAVVEFSNHREIWTRQEAQRYAEPWFSAASLCRSALPLPHQESHPAVAELAKALSMAAQYLEDQGQLREQNPYIVERTSKERGDDEVRVQVRLLAAQTFTLFGSFLYGIIAKVATVALQTTPTINNHNVRNWCSGLDKNLLLKKAEAQSGPKSPTPKDADPHRNDEKYPDVARIEILD